jgi:hypothetical protein
VFRADLTKETPTMQIQRNILPALPYQINT